MSEFQSGRVAGSHAVGSRVDDLLELYEKELHNLDAMKLAFGMAGQALENYRQAMVSDLAQAKIPIKEGEYGKTYVNRCIDIVRQLHNDAEIRRLKAQGSVEALQRAVADIKSVYDVERDKLAQQQKFENDPDPIPLTRPVGANPGNPIQAIKTSQASRETKQIGKRSKRDG